MAQTQPVGARGALRSSTPVLQTRDRPNTSSESPPTIFPYCPPPAFQSWVTVTDQTHTFGRLGPICCQDAIVLAVGPPQVKHSNTPVEVLMYVTLGFPGCL